MGLRLGLFPASRFRRPKNRVDYCHISNTRFEGYGNLGVITDCAGEEIALGRVLVAFRNLVGFDAGTGDVAAVIQKNAAGAVGRRVEGDLDFESAAST